MNYFLALQNSYGAAHVALYCYNQNSTVGTLLSECSIDKRHASKDLVPKINELLEKADIRLADIAFIATNQGPGPFTTLRVVITTANGISFASGITQIGIDALQAGYKQAKTDAYPVNIIMYNAFAQDVYLLIAKNGTELFTGYKNIENLLAELESETDQIYFWGNGARLHSDLIKSRLGDKATISTDGDYCSLDTIAQMALEKWCAGDKGQPELMPLYLKQHMIS